MKYKKMMLKSATPMVIMALLSSSSAMVQSTHSNLSSTAEKTQIIQPKTITLH